MSDISPIQNKQVQPDPPAQVQESEQQQYNNQAEPFEGQEATKKNGQDVIYPQKKSQPDLAVADINVPIEEQEQEAHPQEDQNLQIALVNNEKLVSEKEMQQKSEKRVQLDKKPTIKRQPQQFKKSQEKKTLKMKKKIENSKKQGHHNSNATVKDLLMENKLIRVIFNHFCKENNLTSIKSSLFDDKQKKLQEMSLNKWMVFCKEFQIHQKLCMIKGSARRAKISSQQLSLQTSQVRQFHRVKEAKQVEKNLAAIFKKSNKNASKIDFQAFVTGICEIYHEFRQFYPQQQKGLNQFLSEVMFCSDEKSCFKKLSHLKFTSATPQIEYNKLSFPEGEVKCRPKSRVILSKIKENIDADLYTLESANKQKTISRNFTKLSLNPILIEAKKSIKQEKTYSKRVFKYQDTLLKLNSKENAKPKEQQKELIQYFQSTEDPILNSFFMLENGKRMSTEAKH